MKDNIKKRFEQMIAPVKEQLPEISFKLLSINEKDLVKELDSQYKLGYEPIEFLDKKEPGPYSDDRSYKILLRKK